MGLRPMLCLRGPPDVETVGADGEESEVSIEGGLGGRFWCCGKYGEESGIGNGDTGREMLDGEVADMPLGDIARLIMLCWAYSSEMGGRSGASFPTPYPVGLERLL
jgi:hypothetical protein